MPYDFRVWTLSWTGWHRWPRSHVITDSHYDMNIATFLCLQAHRNVVHVARLIFFLLTTHGKDVKSARPLLNLLDIFKGKNVYYLHALTSTHFWHKRLLPNTFFAFIFQYASRIHSYDTRYATQQNLYKPCVRTNTGKRMISFVAIDLWKISHNTLNT